MGHGIQSQDLTLFLGTLGSLMCQKIETLGPRLGKSLSIKIREKFLQQISSQSMCNFLQFAFLSHYFIGAYSLLVHTQFLMNG